MGTGSAEAGQDRLGYRPGSWFGLFGEHATVVLPPTERRRVMALWEAVDDGAGFAETLDVLVSGGLRDLPAFVLLGYEGASVQLLLRGPATARVEREDEVVDLDGASARTWLERSFDDVVALRLDLEEAAAYAEDAPVPPGAVLRVGSVTVGAPGPVVRASEPEQVTDLGPDTEEAVAPFAEPGPSPEPSVPTETDDRAEHREDRAEDGAEPTPAPPAVLEFSHGERVVVDRSVLIGRAPEARRFSASDQPRLVTVPSPHSEISSTHVEIRPGLAGEGHAVVVTDLGSTNGTVVVAPGSDPLELRAGVPEALVPGAVVDLGDGLTITRSSR